MSGPSDAPASGGRSRWRSVAIITLGAVALFEGVRRLPTGTYLSQQDPRKQASNPIEFCDPLRPQFVPAETVPSPVRMTVEPVHLVAGQAAELHFTLKTLNGDFVGPQDLVEVQTKKIHLLVVDPTLTDYQHVHPEPDGARGRWKVAINPRFGGVYRLFADFTPVVTQRSLYATADLDVEGMAAQPADFSRDLAKGPVVAVGDYRFTLVAKQPVRAGTVPADLALTVTRADGGKVPMEPIMAAFAHLVAFDAGRTGFAHMHPLETDISHLPDDRHPTLSFKLALPAKGRYVIWAEVLLAGRETYAPFWFDVTESE